MISYKVKLDPSGFENLEDLKRLKSIIKHKIKNHPENKVRAVKTGLMRLDDIYKNNDEALPKSVTDALIDYKIDNLTYYPNHGFDEGWKVIQKFVFYFDTYYTIKIKYKCIETDYYDCQIIEIWKNDTLVDIFRDGEDEYYGTDEIPEELNELVRNISGYSYFSNNSSIGSDISRRDQIIPKIK